VVPIPTFPPLSTINFVAVDEPITNAGPVIPFGFSESCAHGDVVPMPTFPLNIFVPENVPPDIAGLVSVAVVNVGLVRVPLLVILDDTDDIERPAESPIAPICLARKSRVTKLSGLELFEYEERALCTAEFTIELISEFV